MLQCREPSSSGIPDPMGGFAAPASLMHSWWAPSPPPPGRRPVPVPGLGRAREPLLSLPIYLPLGFTADTWDVTFWHMRLQGSSEAGAGARARLSQPGTCQTKSHSWWGVKLAPGAGLDQNGLLESDDNVGLVGAHLTGCTPWHVLGSRMGAAGTRMSGGKWRCLILGLVFRFVASSCLLTFEQIVLMQIGYFALFWVSYMHGDH